MNQKDIKAIQRLLDMGAKVDICKLTTAKSVLDKLPNAHEAWVVHVKVYDLAGRFIGILEEIVDTRDQPGGVLTETLQHLAHELQAMRPRMLAAAASLRADDIRRQQQRMNRRWDDDSDQAHET